MAVDGRCPHRHFPLGESKRVGDAIQCGYHGITFGADGKCTFVPSQTAIPSVYSINAYSLVERGLWAWIWPGDADKADEALIPTLDEIGYTLPDMIPSAFYAMHVNGRYQLLNDNLLDLTHLGYLHDTSIGTPDDAATPEERDLSDRRLSSRRYMRDTPQPPLHMDNTDYRGPIDRVSGMDFFFPGFHSGIGEQIEKIIATLDDLPPELMLKSDTTAVQGRRILQAMMDKERSDNAEITTQSSRERANEPV